ncbi:hypothetical protein BN168_570044 [Clostridioides difficile CD002]|nr:hypothetical protein BN168_570044 [Clostridioides difficile CD002]
MLILLNHNYLNQQSSKYLIYYFILTQNLIFESLSIVSINGIILSSLET